MPGVQDLTDEELFSIAGISPKGASSSKPLAPSRAISDFSDDELFEIAGIAKEKRGKIPSQIVSGMAAGPAGLQPTPEDIPSMTTRFINGL